MEHIQIPSNDARLALQPKAGEAVVITRYGRPEYVVLRWEDFMPVEKLIDQYLVDPPFELEASELAVRADAVDREPDGSDFEYDSLGRALDA